MQESIEKIRDLITNIIGEPHSSVYSNGWQSFDCPKCAEANGGVSDKRGNLEVNIDFDKGHYCHCWKCGYAAKIPNLIKEFGNRGQYDEYKNIISDLIAKKQYTLDNVEIEQIKEHIEITLPYDWHPFITDNGYTYKEGFDYLHSRGLTDEMIKDYNLGYVGKNGEPRNKKRIIVPSYDSFGNLTYWLGRDWTNKENKTRYSNSDGSKTSIVFNEGRINVYQPIIICEGVFDHMVLPNSIPILGKSLSAEHAVYNYLMEEAKSDVYICLDNDARKDAYAMYRLLNNGPLKGKIKYIECKNKDASLIFQEEGKRGIVNLIKSAHCLDEFELLMS